MRRYVSVKRNAAGCITVNVTLVDDDISAKWTVKTYLNNVADSIFIADQAARKALQAVQNQLELNRQD